VSWDVVVVADPTTDIDVIGDAEAEVIEVPEQGPPGAKGDKGDKGSTLLSGFGPPSGLVGLDGDYYFDRTARDLRGPKDGTWPASVSLVGDTGPQGTRGSLFYTGGGAPGTISGQADGDDYLDTATGDVYTRAAGSWGGPVGNIRGSKWYTGSGAPSGVADPRSKDQWLDTSSGAVYQYGGSVWALVGNIRGPTGATGTRGSVWYSGSGAPGTLAGQLDGDFYYNTANADVYKLVSGTWTLQNNIKGLTGNTGNTGARGSLWYTGSGAPGTISGQAANDDYLNTANGDVYQYSGSAWSVVGNIKGATGSTGTRGSFWNYGNGVPGTIPGQISGDLYLNTTNDDLYQLVSGSWVLIANIRGFNSVAHVPGTTTNDSAAAGQLGEYVQASGSANFSGSGSAQNFASMPLTAGDWNVAGIAVFGGAGATSSSDWIFNISNVSTPSGTTGSIAPVIAHARQPAGADYSIVLTYPSFQYKLAGSNTIYAHCQSTFSTSTYGATAVMIARRAR